MVVLKLLTELRRFRRFVISISELSSAFENHFPLERENHHVKHEQAVPPVPKVTT